MNGNQAVWSSDEVYEQVKLLLALATGDPLLSELSKQTAQDGTILLAASFTRRLERFDFLPLMDGLKPIIDGRYSNVLGEAPWTITGTCGGRRVILSM